MRKNKLLVAIFTFVLAFSAAFFSACDLLPTLPGGGGDKIENPGGEIEKPGENYGHKEFLIEDFNMQWAYIQELDQENSPRKLTSEHFETFERWMSELRALEWTEDDKKDPDKEKPSEYQKRLDEITRSVRFELGGRMNQKYVPDIRFAYDDTLERAARIDELLNNLK